MATVPPVLVPGVPSASAKTSRMIPAQMTVRKTRSIRPNDGVENLFLVSKVNFSRHFPQPPADLRFRRQQNPERG